MSELFDLQEDATARRSLTVAALLLILVPFFQAGTQSVPLQLGNIQWRFQAANAFSSVLILPYVGLSLLLAVSRLTESRFLSLLIGVASSLLSLVLIGSIAMFALDALQLKTIVSTQAETQFKMTAIRVVLVTGLHVIAFAMLAIAGFRTPGASARGRRDARAQDPSAGLIVGR